MSAPDAKLRRIARKAAVERVGDGGNQPFHAALRAARVAYAAGLRDAAAALDYEVETYSRTVDGLSFPRLRAAILAAIPKEAPDPDHEATPKEQS